MFSNGAGGVTRPSTRTTTESTGRVNRFLWTRGLSKLRTRETHSSSSISRHDQSRVYSFSVDNVEGSSRRTLYVEGLVNARDLGGLRRLDGTTTPRGVFYRSENVDGITPAGWEQVYQTGIRTIVDLRDASERASDRNERPTWIRTLTVELNGFADDEFWRDYLPNGLARTALYFLPHLEAMPNRAVSALSAIVSAPPGGVLFHCLRGRDRTGMISLLLLSAVNTDPEEIVDDYLETVRRGDLRAAWSYENNEEAALEAFCQSLGTSTENAFRTALAALDLRGVLSAADVSPEVEEALMSWRGSIQLHY